MNLKYVTAKRLIAFVYFIVCLSSTALAGVGSGGGGDSIAAQFAVASMNSLKAIKLVCLGMTPAPTICTNVRALQSIISEMKVEPRTRDSILGSDGRPRDAGNDGNKTIFLDVSRWMDKQLESDPGKIPNARKQQISLAIHEPLVLAGAETNDQYKVSGEFVDLLTINHFGFDRLVGTPFSSSHLKYKTFLGKAWGWQDPDGKAALADADEKAQGEGYDNCMPIRVWILPDSHGGYYHMGAEVKCSKPR